MKFPTILHHLCRHRGVVGFAVSWICGLVFGVLFALNTDVIFPDAILRITNSQLSAPGLLFTILLPFVLAACVPAAGHTAWICLLAFLRCVSFAFVAVAIHLNFRSAGWLIMLLLQFGAVCSLPLYCWFCLRRLGGRADQKTDLLITCCFAVAIAAADLYLVAPLLERALSF